MPPQKDDARFTTNDWGQNPFFGMVLFSTAVFVITILAMVAVIFSDPRAPVARFLDAHGSRLIAAEVVVTLIVGLLALITDRLQTRRSRQENPSEQQTANGDEKSSAGERRS